MAETFAGFAPSNIAEYFGVSPLAAQGIIALGNGKTVSTFPADQKAALAQVNINRFKPGATGPNQGFGDIAWGLDHLAQHPLGSHYHGDFNVTDLVANVATGGLYGVAKAGFDVVTSGKILPNLATVQALTLPGGSALQPTVGTKNTLLIEAAAASTALPVLFPTIGTVLAATGGIGAALLNKAKDSVINFVSGSAPSTDSRGAPGAGSPLLPPTGPSPGGGSQLLEVGSNFAGGSGYFDNQGNYMPPAGAPIVAGVDLKLVISVVGLVALVLVIVNMKK